MGTTKTYDNSIISRAFFKKYGKIRPYVNNNRISRKIMGEDDQIRAELDSLEEEHKTLNGMIDELGETGNSFDQLQIRRLKKRKLWLKDKISYLMAELEPDIIA